MTRRFRLNYAVLAIILDIGATLLALSLAISLRPNLPQLPFLVPVPEVNIPPWVYLFVPLLWVLGFLVTTVYDPKHTFKLADELQAVTMGSLLAALLCATLFFLAFREFSRWLFIIFLLLNFILLIGWRLIARPLRPISSIPAVDLGVLIVGAGKLGQRVTQMMEEYKANNFQLSFIELWQDVLIFVSTALKSTQDKFFLSLVLILGAFTRGYFLTRPMRYDEAYTFLNFVNKGNSDIFYYLEPNNHVLHTIFVKISVLVWGAYPHTIRLPAFIAGLLIIPLTFLLCRKVSGRGTGLIASLAVAVSPYIIGYSTDARGYTLLILFGLLLAFLGLFFVEKPVFLRTIVISLVAALGMFTIPSMLFVIVGLSIWLGFLLLIKERSFKVILIKFIIPFGVLTSIFTIILYAPVVWFSDGVDLIVSNRHVASQPWDEFFDHLYPHIKSIFNIFRITFPNLFIYGALFFLFMGFSTSIKEKRWTSLLLLPSLFIGAGIILFINHRIPFTRTWIYLMPFVFILIDLGFNHFNKNLPNRLQSIFPLVILLFGMYFSIQTISKRPISDIPTIVKYLKPLLDDNDKVHVRNPINYSTYFYIWYFDAQEGSQKDNSDTVDEFFIVRKGEDTIGDMTEMPVVELLDFGKLKLYQKVQFEEP